MSTKQKDLERLEKVAQGLDNQFTIPILNVRMGWDAIVGMVPVAGDLLGIVFSIFLVFVMIRNGAGPLLLARMTWNVVLDAAVGVVPFIGDIADVGYRSNLKNVRLLQTYYSEDKERPGLLWSLFLILLFALIAIGLFVAGVVWGLTRLWSWAFN